jgi:hypothetical protein
VCVCVCVCACLYERERQSKFASACMIMYVGMALYVQARASMCLLCSSVRFEHLAICAHELVRIHDIGSLLEDSGKEGRDTCKHATIGGKRSSRSNMPVIAECRSASPLTVPGRHIVMRRFLKASQHSVHTASSLINGVESIKIISCQRINSGILTSRKNRQFECMRMSLVRQLFFYRFNRHLRGRWNFSPTLHRRCLIRRGRRLAGRERPGWRGGGGRRRR